MQTPLHSPPIAAVPRSQASQGTHRLQPVKLSRQAVPLLRKSPPWEGWRKATAVAKRRGGSSVGHNPPQGLLALPPPKRGFGCDFLPHITPRQAVRVLLSLCLILACSVLTPAAPPAETSVDEYQVKAAFLFNFAKFVEWPSEAFSDPNAPLVITVFGDDPFNGSLEAVKGKLVNNRKLTIRRVKEIQDIGKSNVLFVSPSAKKELARVLAALQGLSVLTVGEDGAFTQSGGIINFVNEDNKVRFEINISAAERAGLKISSRLLALARVVRSPAQEGSK